MSTYCSVIYEENVFKTKVAGKSGKSPIWNQTITIALKELMEIRIEVWDKTTKKETLIGKGSLDLN